MHDAKHAITSPNEDQRVDVVILANMDPPAATQVVARVLSVLTGRQLQINTR